MQTEKLFIPTLCKVGFNLRDDTYTGKLGYIIAKDGKKWRKETSWLGWIQNYISPEEIAKEKEDEFNRQVKWAKDNYKQQNKYLDENPSFRSQSHFKQYSLPLEEFLKARGLDYISNYPYVNRNKQIDDPTIVPIEFDNVPTEGFVLNKKVGGYSTGWNHRSTYCRVYDPRGFEFEISLENLLFILQESNSIKGKGLEGEFVYSWSGKDLVLLPVSSSDYQSSTGFTKLQKTNLSTKDLVEGCTYKGKNTTIYIYMGKHNWRFKKKIPDTNKSEMVFEKRHIFYELEYKEFSAVTSLTNFAEKVSDEISDDYSSLVTKLKTKNQLWEIASLDIKPWEVKEPIKDDKNRGWKRVFLKSGSKYKEIDYIDDWDTKWEYPNILDVGPERYAKAVQKIVFKGFNYYYTGIEIDVEALSIKDRTGYERMTQEYLTPRDLQNIYQVEVILTNGKKIKAKDIC